MGRKRVRERDLKESELEETEYKAVNWKKFFLTPKYIRMSAISAIAGKPF